MDEDVLELLDPEVGKLVLAGGGQVTHGGGAEVGGGGGRRWRVNRADRLVFVCV